MTRTIAYIRFFALHILLVVFVLSGMFVFSTQAEAQNQQIIGLPASLNKPVSLTLSPRAPRPGSEVKVRAESFSIDLNRSSISWLVDGRVVQSGEGVVEISLTAGEAGEVAEVEAVIEPPSGPLVRERVLIQPASVDLLWEARSYTPAFYKGKGLLGPSSAITIAAIPHMKTRGGNTLKSEDLIFTWKQGYRVLGTESGRGKDSVTLRGYAFFKDLDVSVEVESIDEGLVAHNAILVPSVSPRVVLYEDHPTRGVGLEQSLRSPIAISNEEVTLVAEPYFFGTETRADAGLFYEWKVNNETVQNPNTDPGAITLRPTSASGAASVNISLGHLDYILQQARNAFRIEF